MPAKKSVKKKQGLLSRINFKSPKTRGLLILAIFAIVGGGFMVYRSFAATLHTWNYNVDGGYMGSGTRYKVNTTLDCKAQNYQEAQKNNATAVSLTCPQGAGNGITRGRAFAASKGAHLPGGAWDNYQYRWCAMIKGNGTFDIITKTAPGARTFSEISTQTHNTGSVSYNAGFQSRCGKAFRISGPTHMEGVVEVGRTNGAAIINVASIQLNQETLTGEAPPPVSSPSTPMNPAPDPKCEVSKNCR